MIMTSEDLLVCTQIAQLFIASCSLLLLRYSRGSSGSHTAAVVDSDLIEKYKDL